MWRARRGRTYDCALLALGAREQLAPLILSSLKVRCTHRVGHVPNGSKPLVVRWLVRAHPSSALGRRSRRGAATAMSMSPRLSVQSSPRSTASGRPITVHRFAHSPRNAVLMQSAGFGSVQDRYKTLSISSSQSSKYFKERGAAIARSTTRERSGASGNTPAAVVGYSREGAPMRGVTAFPFEKQQAAYVEEFVPVVANTLVHPYNAITENNADSTEFNIITGSACTKPPLLACPQRQILIMPPICTQCSMCSIAIGLTRHSSLALTLQGK